jgi:hypothetical protein
MSWRTAPLRVGRSLRDACTGLDGVIAWGLALLGGRMIPAIGRAFAVYFRLDKLKRRANARAPRRRPVRQDMVFCCRFVPHLLHNRWSFDAQVAQGSGHLALGYGCGGEEEDFAGGIGFVEDMVAVVEVVELLG